VAVPLKGIDSSLLSALASLVLSLVLVVVRLGPLVGGDVVSLLSRLVLLSLSLLLLVGLLRLGLEEDEGGGVGLAFCANSFVPLSIPNQYVVGSSVTTPDDNEVSFEDCESLWVLVKCPRGGGGTERGCGDDSVLEVPSFRELAMCSSTARKS